MMKTSDFVKQTCRPGEGALTCRYLVMNASEVRFECVKFSPGYKTMPDQRVAAGTIRAQGDNCEGKPREQAI